MKAITLQQPFAWAVAHAGKFLENRTWTRDYRGPIAIHAGQRIDRDAILPRGVRRPEREELVLGAVIAVAELVDVVTHHRSAWFIGPYAFVLRNVVALEKPVPCKGWLNLWDLEPSVRRRVRAQL